MQASSLDVTWGLWAKHVLWSIRCVRRFSCSIVYHPTIVPWLYIHNYSQSYLHHIIQVVLWSHPLGDVQSRYILLCNNLLITQLSLHIGVLCSTAVYDPLPCRSVPIPRIVRSWGTGCSKEWQLFGLPWNMWLKSVSVQSTSCTYAKEAMHACTQPPLWISLQWLSSLSSMGLYQLSWAWQWIEYTSSYVHAVTKPWLPAGRWLPKTGQNL